MKFTFVFETMVATIVLEEESILCTIVDGEETVESKIEISEAKEDPISPYLLLDQVISDTMEKMETVEYDNGEQHAAWEVAVRAYDDILISRLEQALREARIGLHVITEVIKKEAAADALHKIRGHIQNTLDRMEAAEKGDQDA